MTIQVQQKVGGAREDAKAGRSRRRPKKKAVPGCSVHYRAGNASTGGDGEATGIVNNSIVAICVRNFKGALLTIPVFGTVS